MKKAMMTEMDRAMSGEKVEFGWMEQPTPKQTEKPAAPDVNALQTQIAELKGTLAGMQAGQPSAYKPFPQRPVLPTDVDWSKLPSAITDPEGYGKAVATAVQTVERNKKILEDFDREQAAAQQKALDTMFDDFTAKYPDHAKNREAVEFWAEKAVKNAAARRIDAGEYMFGKPEKFYGDVVKLMDENGFGPKKAEDEGEGDEEPLNRGMGIPGGANGGNPGERRQPQASGIPPENSMLATMRKFQMESGFHA